MPTFNSTTLSPVGAVVAAAQDAATAASSEAQWTASRAAFVLCVIGVIIGVPVIIIFRKPIGSILKPLPGKCGELFRLRNIRRCCIRTFCCSFCPCNLGARGGFERLAEAQEVLTVTLIGADEIKKNMSFYVEVWTEPQEAASKISRTHIQANKGALSLGMERLELDWFGDEEKVIVQVVEFPGAGKEKPLGDVQLQRERVLQYAKESSASRGDLQAGTRRFDVAKLTPDQIKMRKRKLTSPAPFNIMASFMLTKAQEKVGLGIGIHEEEGKNLRTENELLKSQNSDLKTQLTLTRADSTQSSNSSNPMLKPESAMKIVLKFDISARSSMEHVNIMNFKDAEDDNP